MRGEKVIRLVMDIRFCNLHIFQIYEKCLQDLKSGVSFGDLSKEYVPKTSEEEPSVMRRMELTKDKLYDKLVKYFEPAKGNLFKNLENEYTSIDHVIPHSDKPEDDKNYYLEFARNFLLSVTPDAVYFGRYISEENDQIISLKKTKKRKSVKKNKTK